jgi:hypothetical protein
VSAESSTRNTSSRSGRQHAASGDEGRPPQGQYAIYKPVRSGKGGVLRFELNAQMPAVFVEAAHQSQAEMRRFDWEHKIVMKWGLSDLGEVLAVIERRQPEAKLFHQTEKGNTAFEIKHQAERTPPNFFASISRQRAETKDVDKLGISVSLGEAAVLSALLRHAVLVLAGWSA